MASIITRKEKIYKTSALAIFFIIVGTCFLLISLKEISTYNYKNDNYIKTEAKVTKHIYKNGKVSQTIFEYTIDEDSYTISSSNKSDCVKSYGSTVIIKYNPKNPEEIIFTNRNINIVTPILALVLLSFGLSTIIVTLSENIKRIKKFSQIITNKNKINNNNKNINNNSNTIKDNIGLAEVINKDYNNYNKSNNENTDSDNKTYTTQPNIIKNTENANEDKNNEIIDIPFIPEKSIIPNDNIIKDTKANENIDNKSDYIQFMSEINDNNDIPDFIPNIDILKDRKQ